MAAENEHKFMVSSYPSQGMSDVLLGVPGVLSPDTEGVALNSVGSVEKSLAFVYMLHLPALIGLIHDIFVWRSTETG